jgi:hypothetical protein
VVVSFIVNVPENDDPDCVSVQVIAPGPEESDAEPLHVPLTLAGDADGSLGLDEPLLHAATMRHSMTIAAARKGVRGVEARS